MSNPVIWFEIVATDLERAKAFYQQVFHVELAFKDMPDAPMYMFKIDPEEQGAGGALVQSKDNTPSAGGSIIYFCCQDVAIEAGRVEAAGGTLLFPKMSLGEFDFMAQLIDTEGNRIGLHSMS